MKAVDFPESNATLLAGNIPDCYDLPVFKDGQQIVSKWKMSWVERLSALFFGTAYVSVLAPKTAPPILVQVRRSSYRVVL